MGKQAGKESDKQISDKTGKETGKEISKAASKRTTKGNRKNNPKDIKEEPNVKAHKHTESIAVQDEESSKIPKLKARAREAIGTSIPSNVKNTREWLIGEANRKPMPSPNTFMRVILDGFAKAVQKETATLAKQYPSLPKPWCAEQAEKNAGCYFMIAATLARREERGCTVLCSIAFAFEMGDGNERQWPGIVEGAIYGKMQELRREREDSNIGPTESTSSGA